MFWGVTILSGRRYTQTVEKSYHISKAALEIPVDGKNPNKRVQLMLEQNKTHYLLSNLDTEKIVQVDLDLIFTEGEEVTFYLNGDGIVHLSGYVLDFDDGDDDFDEEGLSDEESEDEELTNANAKRVLKPADSASAKKAKVDSAKAVVNGMDDDEDDDDDANILGDLDEELDSDEDDEEDDEEDEEDDDVPQPKPVLKQVNGQAGKAQQQQKGTPAKQPLQAAKNFGSAGKPNQTPKGGQQQNQTPKGGQQQNQNKFGQKGQASPQGQKQPNQNQKAGPPQQQQPKGQFNQNKQQFNKQKGPFTPDQKSGKSFPSGLKVEDVQVGSGPEARKGKFVHVKYIGRLPNNKEFDRSTNKPFSFKLGAGSVIKGWDLGVDGMRVGGKRKLTIGPNMGYGSRSMGPIPANSTLNFEVELVSVS